MMRTTGGAVKVILIFVFLFLVLPYIFMTFDIYIKSEEIRILKNKIQMYERTCSK